MHGFFCGRLFFLKYVCDFLNIFSDFREIKYKKENIDFHVVKHKNKQNDTQEFFDLFFTKYVKHANIDINSKFVFVMKKLNDFDTILEKVAEKYKHVDLKLMIIESKYHSAVLDKNKDDFLCQYILNTFGRNENCILISNDKYRDRKMYIPLFTSSMVVQTIGWHSARNCVERASLQFDVKRQLTEMLQHQSYLRCTIPKRKLGTIM